MNGSTLSEDRIRQGLAAFATLQLITGLALAFVPGSFYDTLANFGPRGDHFLRDMATFYLATALALAMSVGRRSWRVPVLFIVTVQYALHTLNHLIDIGNADPGWVGPFDFISLAALTALLAYLLQSAAKSVGSKASR